MIDKSLLCAFAFQRLPLHTERTALLFPAFLPSSAPLALCPTTSATTVFLTRDAKNNAADSVEDSEKKAKEIEFLKDELDHVESLEEIVNELEEFALEDLGNDDEEMIWSEEALSEIFGESIGSDDDDDDYEEEDDIDADNEDFEDLDEEELTETYMDVRNVNDFRQMEERIKLSAAEDLERALLQGVVPVSAGVGNERLPGDFGFDPLGLADKDYFRQAQGFLLKLLPDKRSEASLQKSEETVVKRPKALILRDLREAEIRHARLGKK